jgi:predicted DNA-binding transcriptional regulator AlpA
MVEKNKAASGLKSSAAKLSTELIEANKQHILAAGLAPDVPQDRHDKKHVHGARAPPAVRLLSKGEVCAITGVTFPTLWQWMRNGQFPRSRVIGRGSNSRSVWRSDEIEAWLAGLPVRSLKGDPSSSEEV